MEFDLALSVRVAVLPCEREHPVANECGQVVGIFGSEGVSETVALLLLALESIGYVRPP